MLFSLKPVFIGWVTFLIQLPIQFFLTFWSGGFFGSFLFMTGLFAKDSHLPFILFGSIAFLGVPLTAYIGKKYSYRQTEYKFYEDRIEFEEGFLTTNKKTIRYKDIREVTLRRGVFQKMYGLGSIYLATLATGTSSGPNPFLTLGFRSVSASGVVIRDIAESEEYYQKIKTIIDSHN